MLGQRRLWKSYIFIAMCILVSLPLRVIFSSTLSFKDKSDYSYFMSEQYNDKPSHSIVRREELKGTKRNDEEASVNVLYITTHFSEAHIRYFQCCWPILTKDSPLVQKSHIVIAATNISTVDEDILAYLQQLFAKNPSYSFITPTNASHLSHCEPFKKPLNPKKKVSVSYKQCLANYGVAFGWSDIFGKNQYSWMIRLNPDVLIRQSQWMLQSMRNKSLDALLIHCGEGTRQIHTDFWAIRPKVLAESTLSATAGTPFQKMGKVGRHLNHERTAYQHFLPILNSGRYSWVPDIEPSQGVCRARGEKAPVFHGHNSCQGDNVCHGLEGWNLRD